MIPGLHYNHMHEVHYEITPKEAAYVFAKQLLTGDTTDNIPGLPKIGAAKAEKLLEGVETEGLMEEVMRQYASKSGKDKWYAYLLEQATLLWIQQSEDQAPPIPEEFDTGGQFDGTIETSLFH